MNEYNDLNECLNCGIPVYKIINIKIDELLQIADDKKILEENINKYKKDLLNKRKEIKDIYDDILLNEEFFDTICFANSIKDSKSYIVANPYYYICRLLKLLNMEEIDIDIYKKDIYLKMLNKCDNLSTVYNTKLLQEEYPLLYNYYMIGNEIWNEVKNKSVNIQVNKYYKYRFKYVLDNFIKEIIDYLKKEIRNYGFIVNDCFEYKNDYNNLNYLEGINPVKLSMLLANKYLDKALSLNDKEYAQNIIYYVFSTITKEDILNISFEVNGEVINLYTLHNKYIQLNKKYNLVPLNKNREDYIGKTREEVNDMIKDEIDIKKINHKHKSSIPRDRLSKEELIRFNLDNREERSIMYEVPNVIKEREINEGRRYKAVKSRKSSKVLYKKSYEALVNLYARKINVLNMYKPRKVYTDQFGLDGYIYYVFDNGIVVREKLFESYKELKYAKDEGAFIFRADSFFKYFECSKDELIELPNSLVRRIYHGESYESILKSYLDLAVTDKTIEKTDKLIESLDILDSFKIKGRK